MVFHWILSDSKPPQVSRTLLSILTVLNNVVIWMVSTRPLTSNSSNPFSNPFVTVPDTPITIGIIVTRMFHSFFHSLARSRYLSFFSLSFRFILWSARTAKSTILQVFFFFFFFWLIFIRSCLLAEIRWSVCMLKSHKSLCILLLLLIVVVVVVVVVRLKKLRWKRFTYKCDIQALKNAYLNVWKMLKIS